MKKRLSILFLSAILCFAVSTSKAQEAAVEEESPFSMTITLNSDQFFGFYPFFAGSYALSEKTAFTFYGILWSGGTGSAWGNWTEFGVGMSFSPMEGLSINPQLGVLSGSLLSGQVLSDNRGEFGDGIVPNLTIVLDKDKVEGEIYAGYYLGLEHASPSTLNYLHYWANGGFKFNKFLSAGLHFEHLRLMGGSNVDEGQDYYMSAGPYVQFADPNGGSFARFHAGPNLADEATRAVNSSSFWKLTVGYNF